MKRNVDFLFISMLSTLSPKNQIKWFASGDSFTCLSDRPCEADTYHQNRYPGFVGVNFHPDAHEYPYPPRAVNMTYDGLHSSG